MRNVLLVSRSRPSWLYAGLLVAIAACAPEPPETAPGPDTTMSGGANGGGGTGGAGGKKTGGSGGNKGKGGSGGTVSGGSGGADEGAGGGGAGGSNALPVDAALPADSAATPDSATPDGPPAAPTFTELYSTVFGTPVGTPKTCAGAACHNPGKMDKIDMSSKAVAYTTLAKVLKAGDPVNSTLVKRLESADAAKRMPLKAGPLDKAVIDKVKAWITAGAMNN